MFWLEAKLVVCCGQQWWVDTLSWLSEVCRPTYSDRC